ncbi:MAG: hypothetical protein MJK04_31930 [Psychrosphaera sp.]|nr:hypothetical protein [Psychrosphaera sp.]
MFASYVLLTRPGLFQRYIIVSPSLWYDNKKLFDLQKRHAKRNNKLKARVFYAVGSEENRSGQPMVDQLTAFYEALKQSQYKGLSLNKRIFKDENHNSIFPTALTTGLRTVFDQ